MDTQTGTYLDKGYLALFANQIVNAVNGTQVVAIHTKAGRAIWEGPTQDHAAVQWDRVDWSQVEQPGGLYQLDKNHHVYVFKLGVSEQPNLSIFVNTSDALDFDTIHYLLKPLIQCLKRQFEINAELSAVRRLSSENQDGLNLLVELDDVAKNASTNQAIQNVLTLCQTHFAVQIAALLVPHIRVQELIGTDDDEVIDKNCYRALAQLYAAARKHDCILLMRTGQSPGMQPIFGSDASVCVVPIKDERDSIIGILVLARDQEFSPSQVGLARAIGSKLANLTGQSSDTASQGHAPRHAFLHQVDNVLKRHPHTKHAILYIDIDKLHVINDSHGHMVGDDVIKATAQIISELAGQDDTIGHLAGDCFALFLKDSDEDKAITKAQVILETIKSRPLKHNDNLIELSASIGIALIPNFAKDSSTGVNVAEIAARTGKDRGGNRYTVFQDLDASVIRRRSDLDQVGDLQSALLEDRFVLYAQPIASLHNDSSSKYEILIRMQDYEGNLVPPDKFLSAAERYQMMSALDRWVLNKALEQVSSSDNMLEINLTTFCINVSGQSLADDDFLPHVESRVRESGLSPDSICFEITETAIVRNLDRAQRFIQHLRRLGCRFALDDFGTGYCSFAYLKNLPVHYLKLDGTFIRDLLDDALSETIVKSITQIGRVMGAATVAEHVENELVKQKLRELGVDYVQGYAIGRPEPLQGILDRVIQPIDLGLEELAAKTS